MYSKFLDYLKTEFPTWTQSHPNHLPTENLISLRVLNLEKKVLNQAQDFINLSYKLRNNLKYQKAVLGHDITQPHFSVLMSFDFHLTSDGLKLIEINTNASHALTVATVLDYLKPDRSQFTNVQTNILKSFTLEHELYFNQQPKKILIVDEKPEQQKAYFEFLMYQELFQKMGLECKIADVSDITYADNYLVYKDQKFSFVYNRSTDFNFDQTPAFLKSYQDHRVCFTPHPEEYKLLADKNRLFDFRNMNFISQFLSTDEIQHLHSIVPSIEKLTLENFDNVWSRRKKLFFKPSQSFGSKAAYKGENVSKNKLQQSLEQQDIVAQEYIPAPEIEVEYNGQSLKSKYDLRFYVYNGTIQLVAARLYQGQTTNFQTVGLGICPVLFDY